MMLTPGTDTRSSVAQSLTDPDLEMHNGPDISSLKRRAADYKHTHPNLIKLESQEECGTSLVDFTQFHMLNFTSITSNLIAACAVVVCSTKTERHFCTLARGSAKSNPLERDELTVSCRYNEHR